MGAVSELLRVHDERDGKPLGGAVAGVLPARIRPRAVDPPPAQPHSTHTWGRLADRRAGGIPAALHRRTVFGYHRRRALAGRRMARCLDGHAGLAAVRRTSRARDTRTRGGAARAGVAMTR